MDFIVRYGMSSGITEITDSVWWFTFISHSHQSVSRLKERKVIEPAKVSGRQVSII